MTNKSQYIFSASLSTFKTLAIARMKAGRGATLLLEGPAGAGKTAFAKAMADELGCSCHYYAGCPDKERDLLYEISVKGVVTKQGEVWKRGPAWRAFEETAHGEFAVLLIDEVDKTSPGFDAFLLRLLEEWNFENPEGNVVQADPSKLLVILTTNGRRKLRPEVLRRTQRINVPLPDNGLLKRIVRQIAGETHIPDNVLDLIIRIGAAVRADNAENAPSPKELALCAIDLLTLASAGVTDTALWAEVAGSYLTKSGGAGHLDKVLKFRWARALREETNKAPLTAPLRLVAG